MRKKRKAVGTVMDWMKGYTLPAEKKTAVGCGSCHCLQESAEGFSAGDCLGGGRCVPLKSTSIADGCCVQGSETASCRNFRSTLMCGSERREESLSLETEETSFVRENGKGDATLSVAGSRARTSVLRSKTPKGSAESEAGCGGSLRASSGKLSRELSSSKTRHNLSGADWSRSWEILPVPGMMRRGMLSQPVTVERATKGGGCGLSDAERWLTPMASDAERSEFKVSSLVKRWAVHPHGNFAEQVAQRKSEAGEDLTGRLNLNPEFVEQLMMFPIGWSDLKPLETRRFHWWLRLHSRACIGFCRED